MESRELKSYLGRVRSYLPIRQSGDILRELDSSIRDRIEDLAASQGREPDEETVRLALEEFGDPEHVASQYLRQRYLIGPDNFRAFVFYSGVTFGLHLGLIGIATALGRPLQFGPLGIGPLGPHGLGSLLASAVHALLLDIGLVALVFGVAESGQRTIRAWSPSLGVEVTPRAAFGRVVFAVLVAVVLNVFRDKLFVVRELTASGSPQLHPLFTSEFAGVMPVITAVLVVGAIKDVVYAWLGERRFTLAADAFHGVLGMGTMLYILQGGPIMALPGAEVFDSYRVALDLFFDQLGDLVVAFLALAFAIKTIRRLVRFAQL